MKKIFSLTIACGLVVSTNLPLSAEAKDVFVDANTVGKAWGSAEGMLQFRGNPTHTRYGEGPVPKNPKVLWKYPRKPMCSSSVAYGKKKVWCGSGWTGQPVLWIRPDTGQPEIIVGTYNRHVHFINPETGKASRPSFPTGDIIKGTVTIDPDGYPLIYFGSRDNKLRIVALDRHKPRKLWSLDAHAVHPTIWNNDWDGNPSIVNDILIEGGENGWFFAIQLNRYMDLRGNVRVNPRRLVQMQGWNRDLLRKVGDRNVSIENSVAVFENRAYFSNSGGRVLGVDLSRIKHLRNGKAPIVFDYWVGDDVDASIVIDDEGMLYVAVELERKKKRALKLGQLLKLNPYRPRNPLEWGIKVPPKTKKGDGGLWATPALAGDYLYAVTHTGRLLVVDRFSGKIVWEDKTLGWHAWSSPNIVDNQLIVATCNGQIRNYDLTDPASPERSWTIKLRSEFCIESTPLIWKGKIFVGVRDGYIYAFGDK
jgi:outer membrane protein assembly factor BamB